MGIPLWKLAFWGDFMWCCMILPDLCLAFMTRVSMVCFHGLRCCNNMGLVTKQHEKNLHSKSDIVNKKMSSWWFQPSWKLLVKLDHFPKYGGKLNNNLKPPPRCEFCSTKALNIEQTKTWYNLRSQLLNDMIFLSQICTKDGWKALKKTIFHPKSVNWWWWIPWVGKLINKKSPTKNKYTPEI